MIEREDFSKIIIDDAASIIEREETDTIPIVDEIRYHLRRENQQQSSLENEEIRLKIDALDELLMKLNVEC